MWGRKDRRSRRPTRRADPASTMMELSVPPAKPWKIHVALTLVSVCFGAFSVVGKIALNDPRVSAAALTELRLLSAALAFLALAALRREAWPRARRLLPLAGLALLGTVINQALFLSGLKFT